MISVDLYEECYNTPIGRKLLRYEIDSESMYFEWNWHKYRGSCTIHLETTGKYDRICSKLDRLEVVSEYYISIWTTTQRLGAFDRLAVVSKYKPL